MGVGTIVTVFLVPQLLMEILRKGASSSYTGLDVVCRAALCLGSLTMFSGGQVPWSLNLAIFVQYLSDIVGLNMTFVCLVSLQIQREKLLNMLSIPAYNYLLNDTGVEQ